MSAVIVKTNGFDPTFLDKKLAQLLGDGTGLLAEAVETNHQFLEPEHFLVYLAKIENSIVRTQMLNPNKVRPEVFTKWVCGCLDPDSPKGIPLQFDPEALSKASQAMLDEFEAEIKKYDLPNGNEFLFVVVVLQHIRNDTQDLLMSMFGAREKLQAFHEKLYKLGTTPAKEIVPFNEQGHINETGFDKSGRKVIKRMGEETAAMGYQKASTAHLLFALLGIDNGILQHALIAQGLDPLKAVHAPLSQQLTRPGAKRNLDFVLRQDSIHDPVIAVLKSAAKEAAEETASSISQLHLARALLAPKTGMAQDILAAHKVNLNALRDYLTTVEEEEDKSPELRRLSMPEIEAELRKHVMEQDYAIRQILPWIKRLRFGFPRERGPAAVLLFMGPSGTGKTQLAKELARTVYGSEDALIMLEMGQFNSKESMNQFIGAPPGYVGYGEGKLTNGLRDKPEAVVLFDEIEKAHEDVWVALMRFLDEGLISDPAGPTRDGRRCIIVLTSNLGADKLAQYLPPDNASSTQINHELEQQIRETVLPYLKRPEIYNRVDDKVVFRPFSREGYKRLVDRMTNSELQKFLNLCDIELVVEPQVLEWLADQAFLAIQEGARCVPRLVNRFVVSPTIDLCSEKENQAIPRVFIRKSEDGTRAEL
jgi:ATP-dependent Clp protease ATP-binding subunit ClpA